MKFERKRKINKTFGIIFTSIAAIGIIGGTILIQQSKKTKEGHDFQGIFGGLGIASGVVYGGISVPFWVCSKKRKKERDKIQIQYIE